MKIGERRGETLSISVYSYSTSIHCENIVEHDIEVYDFEEGKDSRSIIAIGFENEEHPNSKANIYLDRTSAKALAEGIIAKLDQMKYEGKE
ncbi:MAG TPA: hypothetical protein DCZ10_15905 [Pelotomaculum sp.]|nr:hypothetical protein [Pelotomaculum sp.]